MIERRIVSGPIVETSDGKTFEGRVVPYNEPQWIGPPKRGFYEQITPKAFAADLEAKVDVVALFNHNPDHVLGRSTAGTLQLESRADGLWSKIDLPNTSTGRDLGESIRRKDITGQSFGFEVREQAWSLMADKSGAQLRSINDSGIVDVGPVTMPAYASSTATVRSVNGINVVEYGDQRIAALEDWAKRAGYVAKPYRADADETIQCPACKRMNDTDAEYCDQCGVKLEGRTDIMVPAGRGKQDLLIAERRMHAVGIINFGNLGTL